MPKKPSYDYTTAAGQQRMRRDADRQVLDVCKAFNEIQTSGNPLTPEEVDKLIAKRPEMYGVLWRWGTQKAP